MSSPPSTPRPAEATLRLKWLILAAVLFGLLTVGTLVVGFFVFPPPATPCSVTVYNEPFSRGLVHPLIFIFVAIAAAVAGRLFNNPSSGPIGGRKPHLIVGSPKSEPGAAPPAKPPAPTSRLAQVADVLSAVWVQFSIWLFLLIAVIGLVYETWGVGHNNDPWPITFLVRCINNSASIQTLIVTGIVSFVIGSWLLFRDDKGKSGGRG